jgi:3-phenylpropionate/cinnamic acid dioxygenase small subunit
MARTMDAPALELESPLRIRSSDPVYLELREFLDDEADLLDENRFHDWLALIEPDMRYFMPVRVTAQRRDGQGFAEVMGHYDDTYNSLVMRVRRMVETTSAWTEDPPSRVVRFVAGVRAYRTEREGEYRVDSKLLVTRTRSDLAEIKLLSAKRSDLVRRTEAGLRLARRTIYIQQSTIGMQNLAIFL